MSRRDHYAALVGMMGDMPIYQGRPDNRGFIFPGASAEKKAKRKAAKQARKKNRKR